MFELFGVLTRCLGDCVPAFQIREDGFVAWEDLIFWSDSIFFLSTFLQLAKQEL